MTALPQPSSGRWRPLRAGLVELFHYDEQEFWFRDGRLLLRGNNGTGKSKVLALTLPFLLDANLSPHRVEPDGDRAKKMEWNLLLGGEYEDRTGYTWLEFGRVDEHGTEHYFTIGAGLRAVAGRPDMRRWYFTTEQRMGRDIQLIDKTRTVLSRDRLGQALEGAGVVHDNAAHYRRAIDEHLFGLGETRYGALIDLLIQLRQPQLSQRPDEAQLSASLSEALTPLDQAIITDVATAFQNLEEDQDELDRLTAVRDAIAGFAGDYESYARLAILRATVVPRSAQSEYERENRDLAAAKVELGTSRETQALADRAVEQLERKDTSLEAEMATLLEAAHAKGSDLLDAAADALAMARAAERKATGERKSADDLRMRAEDRRQREKSDRDDQAERLSAETEVLLDAAARAGIRDEVRELVVPPGVAPDVTGMTAESLTSVRAEGDRRVQHVAEVRRLSDELAIAQARLREQRGLTMTAEETLGSAIDDVDGSSAAVASTGAELVSTVRAHLLAATELRGDDPGSLAEAISALELWVTTLDGENPTSRWAEAARSETSRDLARSAAELETRMAELDRSIIETRETIGSLESGSIAEPPAAHTRTAVRFEREGSPFWRNVDFVSDVTESDRSGIEAALEASGLLDAWISPSADAIAESGETLLRADPLPSDTTTLADFLVPEESGALPHTVVDTLLRSIAVVPSPATSGAVPAVSPTGQFRLGTLTGAWRKDSAQYIGAMARENDRNRRLGEARAQLAELEGVRDRVEANIRALTSRQSVLQAELTGIPSDSAVTRAHAELSVAIKNRELQADRLSAARDQLAEVTGEEEERSLKLTSTAEDLALPFDADNLREIVEALANLATTARVLDGYLRSFEAAGSRLAAAELDLEAALAVLSTRERELAAARTATIEAEVRHATLDSSVGVEVRELTRQRTDVIASRDATRRDLTEARNAAAAANADRATREERVAGMEHRVSDKAAVRADSARRFQEFAHIGLIGLVLPELELPDLSSDWSPDPTVRLARRVDEALGSIEVSADQWNSAQTRIGKAFDELAGTLSSYNYLAERTTIDDIVIVAIRHGTDTRRAAELVSLLSIEVDNRRQLLTSRERELLQNILVDEVASTLQELIEAAERHKREMNEELAKRPTSTGVRLRIRWEPRADGPSGFGEARGRILRQSADIWSGADREAIAEFLHDRIESVRIENPAGTWIEHLTQALDYRSWNEFKIDIEQNGKWRPASGPASSGEHVLAASVPLFAAASAHYRSAGNPHAPRIITLDEAFAGVDDSARAGYLGLLATFDLDVVMTSEREWAAYPEVPGIGIAQIIRSEGVEGILVERWEWDGANRVMLPDPR